MTGAVTPAFAILEAPAAALHGERGGLWASAGSRCHTQALMRVEGKPEGL